MARTCQSKPRCSRRNEPPPFIPMTGNPENGNYMDWANYLERRDEHPTPDKPIEKQ